MSYATRNTVPITVGVAFFVFGFFIVASLLNLSEHDVLVGLISGTVGGLTMLAVAVVQDRRSHPVSTRAA